MLEVNEIPAHVLEDQSGLGFSGYGIVNQIHKPRVCVDEPMIPAAVELIMKFEEQKRQRKSNDRSQGEIEVLCKDCGKKSLFPYSLDGTTQECPHCYAYVDVGELPWEDDYGTPED